MTDRREPAAPKAANAALSKEEKATKALYFDVHGACLSKGGGGPLGENFCKFNLQDAAAKRRNIGRGL